MAWMLTDRQWAALEPLIETCRPPAKVAPQNLRQTMSAILWRHQNGAKWRAVPEVLGPWWKAAQIFIRCSRLGVWERLLLLAQTGRVALGMTFLDGTSIRAHQKAAGAPRKRIHPHNETSVKRWAGLGAASAPPCGASVSFAA
jgi:transposase